MFTGNKAMIIRECEHRNSLRRVYNGRTDYNNFFQNIIGDLLIAGYGSGNRTMVADLVCHYIKKGNLPTVVLSGHTDLFKMLRKRQNEGEIARVMLSWPENRNYHPFYGMSVQQFFRIIRMAAEEMGYGALTDQILVYGSAILNVVSASYPVSLPAVTKLLQYDDDFISDYALQEGLSNVIADSIRANHEGGIVLRRICESLESIFEDVYAGGSDTKHNFLSGSTGDISIMAFYSMASNQKVLNCYLKEELFSTLKHVPKIRVVLDDAVFVDENDELLNYLFQMKRMGKVELVLISTNVKEAVWGLGLNFPNIVLFHHDDLTVTEELSKSFWGTYPYAYPVPVAGKPPAFLGLTVKSTVHWQIATEERLRVRAEDLYAKPGLFSKGSDLLAVKTTANDNVYLIESSAFLPADRDNAVLLRENGGI